MEEGLKKQKITADEIRVAEATREKYRKSKEALNQTIIENWKWYRLKQWEIMAPDDSSKKPHPVSAWLLNMVLNKHADAMDNYPEPSVLPREAGDKQDAKVLSEILPVVLEHAEYEDVYDETWWDAIIGGTGVYGVFWDKNKDNGIGDIAIRQIDITNLDYQPGVEDIQDSLNVFYTTMVSNDALEAMYPELKDKLNQSNNIETATKWGDDATLDVESMTPVRDWYYKKSVPTETGSRTVLHYVKYCCDTVLYATENDTEGNVVYNIAPMAQTGLYRHGLYPFELHTLFPIKGSPAGFGYVDMCKNQQIFIDKTDQTIMANAIRVANRKTFVSDQADFSVDDYTDPEKTIVKVSNKVSDDYIKQEQIVTLPDFIYNYRMALIDALKETSGNRDFSQGGTSSGVTAASAIAALQEAGSKLSRDENKNAYRVFKKICYMVIELIRQFYDTNRCFRIIGENGAEEYVNYTNANLNQQVDSFGVASAKEPIFDIKVTSQKSSPFSKIAQNELAKELYALGTFNPQFSDQALTMISMMDFEGKDIIEGKISQNGTMMQMIQQLSVIVDQLTGSTLAQASMEQLTGQSVQATGSNPLTSAVMGGAQANKATEKAQNVAKPK